MPTEKKKISAYLGEADSALLEELSKRYQCSQSQVIVLAIRHLAKVESLDNVPGGAALAGAESYVSQDELESALAALRREFKPALDALPLLEALRKN